MKRLKNGEEADKNEVEGEMMNTRGELVKDEILKVCNEASESGVVPKDWKAAVTVPLHKGKKE